MCSTKGIFLVGWVGGVLNWEKCNCTALFATSRRFVLAVYALAILILASLRVLDHGCPAHRMVAVSMFGQLVQLLLIWNQTFNLFKHARRTVKLYTLHTDTSLIVIIINVKSIHFCCLTRW